MERVIIVGGGQAAGQAAASLRQEGYEGAVLMLTEEGHIPYQRPPLSKQFLAGEQDIERVYLRPEKFYADNNVEIRTDARVEKLDLDGHQLSLAGGESLEFSKLILATGARVRRLENFPGGELDGVAYLRTLDDAQALKDALSKAQNLVVVGGGYIGLEVAAVAVAAGASVTVLEMMSRILQRVATPQLSDFYTNTHTAHGVSIKTDAKAVEFIGENGALTGVQLEDGTVLPADLVVVGIGVLPNVELAEAAGLACDNGIVVDAQCATSHPDVFAAGDCTNHPNSFAGKNIRLESVPNAMEQARVAAAMVCGKDKTYESEPWFWSDQYDVKLQMAGFSEGADSQVQRGDLASGAGITFHLKGGVVIGADAINSVRDFLACRKLVAGKVAPDVTKLADPEVPLKELV